MRLIKIGDNEELALRAVVYGCNTNKRLQGASYLADMHSENPKQITFYKAIEIVDEMIDTPTINPESLRPKGEWTECDWVEYDGHGECIHYPKEALRCSNCCNAFKKELLWKRNFCPNCSADMRGEAYAR